MSNKKTLIVVLIAVAVVFIVLFAQAPSKTTPSAETSISATSVPNSNDTPTDFTDIPDIYR